MATNNSIAWNEAGPLERWTNLSKSLKVPDAENTRKVDPDAVEVLKEKEPPVHLPPTPSTPTSQSP